MKTETTDKDEQDARRMTRVRSSRWLGNLLPRLGFGSRGAELCFFAMGALLILMTGLLIIGPIMGREDIAKWAAAPIFIASIFFFIAILLESKARELEIQNLRKAEEDRSMQK